MPLRVAAPTFCNSRHVGLGSWSCENAKTRDHDRRSYSSETALALNRASAFNLTNELKNAMLAAFRFFAFLHTQGHFRTHALQQSATNVRCIHVPIEERPQHRSLTTCSLHIRGSMSFLMYRFDVAYLFERRQVAGEAPNTFLKAREKAASEL